MDNLRMSPKLNDIAFDEFCLLKLTYDRFKTVRGVFSRMTNFIQF